MIKLKTLKDKLCTGREAQIEGAMGQVMLTIVPSDSEEAEELSVTLSREEIEKCLCDDEDE